MNSVQIFRIELNNYRQYRGRVVIDLESTGENHLNVIEGQNGAGKSNLLNALTLCLYEEETHLDTDEDSSLETDPFVNLQYLRDEIDTGESAHGEIEVTLGTDRPEFIFTRKFKTVKLSEEDSYINSTEDLQLRERDGEDWVPITNPHTRRNRILPTKVHEYFLFDGERLDEFFEKDYQHEVKSAILDVSHIELLNRAENHLDNVRTDVEREASKIDSKTQQLKSELENERETLKKLEERYEERGIDIENAETERDEKDKKLSDSRDPEVREKISRREKLDAEIPELKDELRRLKTKAAQKLSQTGQIVYNEHALRYTLETLEEMEDNRELPPKIQDWFINKLIQRGECICGRPIDTDSDPDELEHLEELREEVAGIAEGNIEGKVELPHILNDADDLLSRTQDVPGESEPEETLLDLLDRIEDINEEIDKKNRELEDISNDLETRDVPEDVDIPQLESQRSNLTERIEKMKSERAQLETKIEQQQEAVYEAERSFNNEVKKDRRNESLSRKISFIDRAQNRIDDIKNDILSQVREQTEDAIEEFFNDLIWKPESYEVTITDEYQIRVIGPSGRKRIGSLSAGEKQVLALSFMSALGRISGFEAPMVIDTPLGRISSEPKRRIAENLPEYLGNRQITFLMTDEEYTDEVRSALYPSLANEHKLHYNNETTEVIPYE